jgi:TPR repeat protein
MTKSSSHSYSVDFTRPIEYEKLDFHDLFEDAKDGDVSSILVGHIILMNNFGQFDHGSDPYAAVQWVERGMTRHKDPLCKALFGLALCTGNYTPKNLSRGLRLVEESRSDVEAIANEGNLIAKTILGKIHFNGVDRTSEEKAFNLFLEAAQAGEPWAKQFLGYCYAHGFGVSFDPEKKTTGQRLVATELSREFFEQYDATAKRASAISFNQDKARKWLLEAAEVHQSAEAMCLLGDLCLQATAPNYAEAFSWYKRSRDAGSIDATLRVADWSEKGVGTWKGCIDPGVAFACHTKLIDTPRVSWDRDFFEKCRANLVDLIKRTDTMISEDEDGERHLVWGEYPSSISADYVIPHRPLPPALQKRHQAYII